MKTFPISALVGQDELKLALALNAVDPGIGGVLIRGEKGAGKSTAARGLAALLPNAAPFVELPVGATEDRVVGALDLQGALVDGQRRLQPGLLAAAHGGVLYVDEVNLLPDHLVDVLLDVAASGVNRVERDGLALQHPSRFILVGSMNPEEGELRPQLLDRFGLTVEVRAPAHPDERAEAVRRRLAFESDASALIARFADDDQRLAASISAAIAALPTTTVPDEVLTFVATFCAELGAEGLRADLVLAKGAKVLAALDGRSTATTDDVVRLAPLALAHRRRRGPFDTPGLDPDDLADALERASADNDRGAEQADADADADDSPSSDGTGQASNSAGEMRDPAGARDGISLTLTTQRPSGALGRRNRGATSRGGVVAARPITSAANQSPFQQHDLAIAATAQAVAVRRSLDSTGTRTLVRDDLREAIREARTANLIVFAVDASGSMGAEQRMEAAKGALLSLLLDAYQRRDRVALITFRGDEAQIVLRPTGSVEVARTRLAELPTGGRTPLAAGIHAALELARSEARRDPVRRPAVVIVSDGRATAGPEGIDPVQAALDAAAEVARSGMDALVVDAENGHTRLGLARDLADAMAARYVSLPDLHAPDLARVITEMSSE